MTRRERLMKTLRGEPVDRPAVNFYEITGYCLKPDDPDAYNIYNDPSWKPLIDLAEAETEIIRFGHLNSRTSHPELHEKHYHYETWEEGRSRFTRMTVKAGSRTLTQLSRRDAEVDTVWILEHLLKDTDDLRAYLDLPGELFEGEADVSAMVRQEQELGEAGIVMVNAGDPICSAAAFFSMEEYTIIALTEQELFHRLLRKLSPGIYHQTETVARDFPGRLWRICGSEYASEPYLPPSLYKEYVADYTGPMIKTIQRYGGFARLHSHGRLRNILPHIAAMKPDGLDPIEPPGQGDVELREVREKYGREWVLFGNIEVSDIENLAPGEFAKKVDKAIREGTYGEGRGFVLMPSASPYGRRITQRTLDNYTTMVKLAQGSQAR
jgi:uroporphyrinogen-III decarboxylase